MLHILVNIDLVLNIILYPLEIKFSYKVFILGDLRLRPKINFLVCDFITIIWTASTLILSQNGICNESYYGLIK